MEYKVTIEVTNPKYGEGWTRRLATAYARTIPAAAREAHSRVRWLKKHGHFKGVKTGG